MNNLLLLSKNTPIAQIIDGEIKPILPDRMPLYLSRTGDILGWLAARAVDAHRTNSRLLKKALRLQERDDVSTVLSVNAATITDNYWVKPVDDAATIYADVRFSVNRFDNLALTGDVDSFNQPPSQTPELTNTGSFEKCWRRIGGEWWMLKAGKPEELFSELLIYRIGKRLGFPMAEYRAEGGYIKSRDFTSDARVDFEPAAGIIGEQSDYIIIYEALKPFGKAVTYAYLQMCYLDALVINMDRHENNFGVLRDSETGAVLSLAPFFDHNIALVSRGYSQVQTFENDRLINDFTALMAYVNEPLTVRSLTEPDLASLVRDIPWKLPLKDGVTDTVQFVVRYLLRRQERLMELNRDFVNFRAAKPKDRDSR
jgi:hypothetical protein